MDWGNRILARAGGAQDNAAVREGRLGIRVCGGDGATRLVELDQAAPLRALIPNHIQGEPLTAYLTNTSGGLVGGDRLRIEARAEGGASLLIAAQAAEKVYRSTGPDVTIDVQLHAGAGSWLEWLPQETILFDCARLRRQTQLFLDPQAKALAGEILVFGRKAHGEELRRGLLREAWRVRIGEKLVWSDALHIDDDLAAAIQRPAGFDSARAAATIIAYSPALDLDEIRAGLDAESGIRAAATLINGLAVIRFSGRDALTLRQAFGRSWQYLRHSLGGFAPRLPRLWHV